MSKEYTKICKVCKREIPEKYLLTLKNPTFIIDEKEVTLDTDISACGMQCLCLSIKVHLRKEYNRDARIKSAIKTIESEADPGIVKHLKWFNEHGFVTLFSCSGLKKDHETKDHSKLMPMIVFSLYDTKKDLHRPLVEAVKKLDVFLETFFYEKKRPYALYCMFSDPDKVISALFSERSDQVTENRYPDDIVLEKINKLMSLLQYTQPRKILSLEEYPNFTYEGFVPLPLIPLGRINNEGI